MWPPPPCMLKWTSALEHHKDSENFLALLFFLPSSGAPVGTLKSLALSPPPYVYENGLQLSLHLASKEVTSQGLRLWTIWDSGPGAPVGTESVLVSFLFFCRGGMGHTSCSWDLSTDSEHTWWLQDAPTACTHHVFWQWARARLQISNACFFDCDISDCKISHTTRKQKKKHSKILAVEKGVEHWVRNSVVSRSPTHKWYPGVSQLKEKCPD